MSQASNDEDLFPYDMFRDKRGRTLPDAPEEYNEDLTAANITYYLVDTIRQSVSDDVTGALWQLKQEVRNEETITLQRFWKRKVTYAGGSKSYTQPRLDTTAQAMAILTFLFCPEEDVDTCTRCANKRSIGPLDMCFVPTSTHLADACVNCVYHGRGTECTHRKAAQDRAKEELGKKMGEWKGVTDHKLKSMSNDEVREMMKTSINELQRRKK